MNSETLSLQSALFQIVAPLGGTWAPARAVAGDVAISALAPIAGGGTVTANLAICAGEFLAYTKTANLAAESGAAVTFRAGAIVPLANLEFDTLRDALDAARAKVHSAQLEALTKIETQRVAEAAANLH